MRPKGFFHYQSSDRRALSILLVACLLIAVSMLIFSPPAGKAGEHRIQLPEHWWEKRKNKKQIEKKSKDNQPKKRSNENTDIRSREDGFVFLRPAEFRA